MSILKGYYAYPAIVAGMVLGFAAGNNWMLGVVSSALIAAGAFSVQGASRWYLRASISADILMGTQVAFGTAGIMPDFAVGLLLRWNGG